MDIFILFINGIGGYNQNIEDKLDKYVCIKLRSNIHPKIHNTNILTLEGNLD